MVNELLVNLVNSVLGSGKQTARNNYAYHCPFCHHHKPKLEVNLTENREGQNQWHCWACNKKGKTLYNLFKLLKSSPEKLKEAKSLISSSRSIKDTKVEYSIALPDEYISLSTGDLSDISARHAIAYLKRRNISKYDVLKYNIGYCKSGKYANMIILPTYDKDGNINYFTARSFEKEPYVKYRNPEASRNVIPNEHLVNWEIPIILCEGMFDAIAIKRNAIPLFGKNISEKLMKKLVTTSVNKVYLALDQDAIKATYKIAEKLLKAGKKLFVIELEDKDPADMGFVHFTNKVQEAQPFTFPDLFKLKLSL